MIFPIYSKNLKHKYNETYEKLYRGFLEKNPASIIFIEDSVGGGFTIYLRKT